MSSWFTEIEEVAYSIVEYIPLIGTVYSLERAGIAYKEHDWSSHWQSVGNFLESSVRDIVLFKELAEPAEIVVLHAIAESLTDKAIEMYNREPKLKEVAKKLVKGKGHVLVIESSKEKYNKSKIFEGKAKGVHHFHRAIFTGSFTHPKYAPNSENIQLYIHQGLFDGAPVTFSWKWTQDSHGKKNRPEITIGFVKLTAGEPTEFTLPYRKGVNGWEGYDFRCFVMSTDTILAKTTFADHNTTIEFKRLRGT